MLIRKGSYDLKTSLVQTIGRAARHVNGKVIMYADKQTESMKFAISETNRRRAYQSEYNQKHGITPTGIIKAIRDKLVDDEIEKVQSNYSEWAEQEKMPAREIKRLIKNLEDQMYVYAQNLQFEKAAKIRDEINQLQLKLGK
jgi:excinuclease ABC subunit B